MAARLLFDPGDNATIEISWLDVLPTGVTLASVVHTVPSPLIKGTESTNTTDSKSFVKVSGAVHGGLYQIEASATLSNSDVINRQWRVQGWNA